MQKRVSPCLGCRRVDDPRECENKNCRLWQRWFLERWDTMRQNLRRQMDNAPAQPVGCAVSGQQYAAPHQVEAYLDQDPCESCLCPRDLCNGQPCRIRRAWDRAREEVLL